MIQRMEIVSHERRPEEFNFYTLVKQRLGKDSIASKDRAVGQMSKQKKLC